MKLAAVLAVSVAAGFALLWFVRAAGMIPPAGSLLLVGAAAGGVLGWLAAPHVPIWVPVALAAGGAGAVVLGLSDYNDDGPSGPLFEPMLFLGARVIPVLLISTIAVAVVGGLRLGAEE